MVLCGFVFFFSMNIHFSLVFHSLRSSISQLFYPGGSLEMIIHISGNHNIKMIVLTSLSTLE